MKQIRLLFCVLVLAVSVAAGQSLGFAGAPDNAFIEECPWAGTSQKPESIQQQRVPGDSTPCGGAQTTPCQSRSGDRADRVKLTSELPESPSTYVPLSRREKFDPFLRITCAPHTFFSAAFAASLAQAEGQWYEYGAVYQDGASVSAAASAQLRLLATARSYSAADLDSSIADRRQDR